MIGSVLLACVGRSAGSPPAGDDEAPSARKRERVRPGISVLLTDSLGLIKDRRVGLITNQTGVNERGESDIDLLGRGERAKGAGAKLVALYAPEHGIRGTEDREGLASGVDTRTGVPIHSLYTAGTIGPPDSTLRGVDVIVFDLQDIGTRTWTYVGVLIYALRSASRNHLPIIVLDRPNPINGLTFEAPLLDSSLANPNDPTPTRPGRAYALYPFPLRHGMTMGEMARFYNAELSIGADLHVVPAKGWRRAMWFDETGLPWVRPSPNLPTLTSALTYPALVAFEGSNLSVGRGTPEAFQRIGAPWLNADSVAKLLNDLTLSGVRFVPERFTPRAPGDRKFDGRTIPGIRIEVRDREKIRAARVGAALLWALGRVHSDSLKLNANTFDLRFGVARAREALLRGEDPDGVIDRETPSAVTFEQRARRYYLYH
jgi:uncharacterized protein YbbC (DUF1343 family)